MARPFFVMELDKYGQIINDALNVAEAGEDASPTGLEVLDNFLYPNLQQRKEFGQQVALTKMQQDFAVSGKMAAAKEVGINPHTMADGIAGASSPYAGAPNSAVGQGASSLGAVAGLGDAASNVFNAGVNAYEKISLTGVEHEKRKAEIRNILSAALHNDWLAYSISELLPEQKNNQRADTYLKLANYEKAKEEKNLIIKRVEETEAHIEELKQQANLYKEQGDLVRFQQTQTLYQTAQIELQNNKLQWDKNWRDMYKYDPNNPVDVALEQAMVNGAGQDVIDAIGTAIINTEYLSQTGNLQAAVENAFDLENNKKRGQLDSLGEEIATRLDGRRKELEQNKEFQEELAKIDVGKESANKVISLFLKYLFGVGFNVSVGKVGVNNSQPSGL